MEDISKRSLSIERTFNAPIELLWKVWTTPELIKEWWGPDGFTNTIHVMDVRIGGEWKFIMHGPDGKDYRNEYIYEDIVPLKRIVLKHLTGPKFKTTIMFSDKGNSSYMHWQMVFEAAPDLEKAISVFRADEGLKQNVDKLSHYLNTFNMHQTIITKQLEQKQLLVEREFRGPIDLVWKAWTDPELLDQWWAPKPWKTVTKSMDFREGGRWLYSMNGPEGEQHWARADYKKITPGKNYEAADAFCDEEGNDNSDIPSMNWSVRFTSTETGTMVYITISAPEAIAIEKIIEMGFKEGFTMAHGNLDELLEELQMTNDK